MEYVELRVFCRKTILVQGYFVKHFIFKAHPLPMEQEVFQNRTKSPRLNHPGVSIVFHWFSISMTSTGLLVHHSSRLNAGPFKTIFQNILVNKTLIVKYMP
jgi:hypothetical protein